MRGVHLPVTVLLLAFFVLALGSAGPNAMLGLLATLVFVLAFVFLWRPTESPILLVAVLVQWLQVCIPVFKSNFLGATVNQLSELNVDTEQAILLSEVGLIFLILGLSIGAGPWRQEVGGLSKEIANAIPEKTFFKYYLVAFAISLIAEFAATRIVALTQPLIGLANLKWAFYWMLGYASMVRPRASKIFFLVAFLFELGWGLGSFFSDFKTVFIVTILVISAAQVRVTPGIAMALASLAVALLLFGSAWSVIKPQYRGYVNAGSGEQVVTISYGERLNKLIELVGNLDSNALAEGSVILADRLAYVEYFGAVIKYVPQFAPYQSGELWLDAIVRPFMPRALFPNKAIINDSARTTQFTGLSVTGGTSISLGFFAEAYIDFGPFGMMAPLFGLGLFYGRIYRWFCLSPHFKGPLAMGFVSAIFLGILFAESSITKVFGGLIASLLAAFILGKYLVPLFAPLLQVRAYSTNA